MPTRCNCSDLPRVATQPATAKANRIFSSAPHVSPRGTLSARWLVFRATMRAISRSGFVGLTVTSAITSSVAASAEPVTPLFVLHLPS